MRATGWPHNTRVITMSARIKNNHIISYSCAYAVCGSKLGRATAAQWDNEGGGGAYVNGTKGPKGRGAATVDVYG